MPYRAPAPRDDTPTKPASHVFVLRKYGRVWISVLTLLAVVSLLAGALFYTTTTIECSRVAAGAPASCSFVQHRLIGTQSASLPPTPGSVHEQDALLSDDDARPTLGIHPDGQSIQWFQLGSRNAQVESAFSAFVSGQQAGQLTLPLARDISLAIFVPLTGIGMLALVLMLESWQSVLVWADSGRVQVTRRGLLRRPVELVLELDEMDEATTRQEGSDSKFYWVEVKGGGKVCDVCVGDESAIEPIHKCLSRTLEERKRARRAQGG